MTSLNPIIIPNHLPHSRSPSVSSSTSSAHPLYDLYPSSNYPLGRPPQQLHNRNLSNSSAAFSTYITSPADSPPQPEPSYNAQSAFKPFSSHHLGRSISTRRARADSSPYSRTPGDDQHSLSGSSRASSSSDIEQDDLAIFYPNQQRMPHHQQDLYSGLFVAPHANGFGLPMGLGSDATPNVGGFAPMSLGQEQTLEQLAANVRASTTTTASDRAKQIFVQAWLSANYAPYPDGNVPRQGLYNSYRRVCDQHNIPHINTATLGKAIRLCFPAIKTRRLGVRGNSKYHYCGIRPATVAEAEWLQDFVRRTTNHAAIAASSRRGAAAVAAAQNDSNNGSDDEDEDESESSSAEAKPEPQFTLNHMPVSTSGGYPLPLTLAGGMKSPTLFMAVDDKTPTTNRALSAAQEQAGMNLGLKMNPAGGLSYGTSQAQIRNRRGLGSADQNPTANGRPGTSGSGTSSAPASGSMNGFVSQAASAPVAQHSGPASVRQLRNFPSIDEALGIDTKNNNANGSPSSSNASNPLAPHHRAAIEVWGWFEDHLDGLMESVRSWRFDQFELHLRTFWASLSGEHREIVHAPALTGLMVKADAVVYNEILEILRNQIVTPVPTHALSSLRQLAEKMESILLLSLELYGGTFVEPKVELGARFGHLVLRFLDIFQVTQALSSVLSNKGQLMDMRRSWGEIDFESVRNQCALVCNCRHDYLVQLLEVDFVNVLDVLMANVDTPNPSTGMVEPVREIMTWADGCCERLMTGNVAGPASDDGGATMSSRSVLIRWNYVTSQIMRDLTIRSDPAFGAFQILKLFLDDWIALNVLRGVALSTNSVQASVEPIMPQQYLALSPMPGQEFTGNGSSSSNNNMNSIHLQLMDHPSTTSTMLAALNDPYSSHQSHHYQPHQSSGLSNSYIPTDPSAFSSLAYGNSNGSSHDTDLGLGSDPSGMMGSLGGYADFSSGSGMGGHGSFDITSFLTSASTAAAAAGGPVEILDDNNSAGSPSDSNGRARGSPSGGDKDNGNDAGGVPSDVKEETA